MKIQATQKTHKNETDGFEFEGGEIHISDYTKKVLASEGFETRMWIGESKGFYAFIVKKLDGTFSVRKWIERECYLRIAMNAGAV